MSSNATKNNDEKGGNRKKNNSAVIITAVISIIVVIAIVIAVILFASKSKNAEPETGPEPEETVAEEAAAVEEPERRDVVTADTAEEIAEELFSNTPVNVPLSYTVTQNSDWTFPDGSSPSSDAYVENDVSNETPVYFDLIVDETGEVVYSSPILALGASIDNITLDTPLEAGTYVCTVEYHLVDEEQNTLTTVNVGVNLNVLK